MLPVMWAKYVAIVPKSGAYDIISIKPPTIKINKGKIELATTPISGAVLSTIPIIIGTAIIIKIAAARKILPKV